MIIFGSSYSRVFFSFLPPFFPFSHSPRLSHPHFFSTFLPLFLRSSAYLFLSFTLPLFLPAFLPPFMAFPLSFFRPAFLHPLLSLSSCLPFYPPFLSSSFPRFLPLCLPTLLTSYLSLLIPISLPSFFPVFLTSTLSCCLPSSHIASPFTAASQHRFTSAIGELVTSPMMEYLCMMRRAF